MLQILHQTFGGNQDKQLTHETLTQTVIQLEITKQSKELIAANDII